MRELGIETYFPVVREMRPVPRRQLSHAQRISGVIIMRPRAGPLLAGVVFTRGDPDNRASWRDLFDLPSIRGFVCAGDRAIAFPHAVIISLRAREIDGTIAGRTPARMIFKIGERVRVANGPFTTFPGIVEQVPDVAIEDIDPETRLRLTIDIFGRPTNVELAAWQIEKL